MSDPNSDVKIEKNSNEAEIPAELLANLDLLLNMESLENEDLWELISEASVEEQSALSDSTLKDE